MKDQYQPKGGMCKTCVKSVDVCKHLPFNAMPVIEKYREDETTVNIVRCTEFERQK